MSSMPESFNAKHDHEIKPNNCNHFSKHIQTCTKQDARFIASLCTFKEFQHCSNCSEWCDKQIFRTSLQLKSLVVCMYLLAVM